MSSSRQRKEVKKIDTVQSKVVDTSNKKNSFIGINLTNKLILFVCALLLYGWTYQFDYAIDDKFITSSINNIDNTFEGFLAIFKTWFAGADYRPISFLSFWLERKFHGSANPHISHIVNVFLFALLLCKIYDFIIISKLYSNKDKLIALAILSSFLFAVHPNHVSIVANIKARDNLLSMLFGLYAAIAFIKFIDFKKKISLLTFLIFITLALLSKKDAYIFIITPFLVLFFFREFDKKRILKYVAIISFLVIITLIIISAFTSLLNQDEYIFKMGYDENPLIANNTIVNRIAYSITSLFYYIKFLVVPFGYYFFFGYDQIKISGLFSIINITTIIAIVLIFYFCIKAYSKNKIYIFSFIFFFLSIVYALNFFIVVAGIVMDKYNFIASLGFCIALSALCIDYLKLESIKQLKNPVIISVLIIYTFFTIYRTKDWKNSFSVIEKDMPYLTQSVNANRMASGLYINTALDEELQPNHNKNRTDSLIEIGQKYAENGLNVYNKVPDLWELLGLSYFYKKDFNTALSCFLKGKEVDSTYLSGQNYIGYTYWQLNKIDSAIYYFKYVIDREPVFYYSANNLVNLYVQYNRRKELDSLMETFQNRFPDDKWYNRRKEEVYKWH